MEQKTAVNAILEKYESEKKEMINIDNDISFLQKKLSKKAIERALKVKKFTEYETALATLGYLFETGKHEEENDNSHHNSPYSRYPER